MTLKQSFKAAAAAIGMAAITACAPPPNDNQKPGMGERRLSAGEIEMARKIFGNQINYNRIFITRSNSDDVSSVMSGRMRMAQSIYSDDFSRTQNSHKISVYFHELTHIWQEQQGVNLADNAIALFFKHGGDYSKAYEYDRNDLLRYPRLSIEQQAEILERYVYLRESLADYNKNGLCPEIRQLEGALTPTFPAIETPGLCR